jgi:VanZ family protein
MALIFIVSHLPISDTGSGLPISDKLVHFAEYSILGFLMIRYFVLVRGRNTNSSYFLTMLFGTLYAVSDEIHQGFVGFFESGVFGGVRNPDPADVIADVSGLLAACLIYHIISFRLLGNK